MKKFISEMEERAKCLTEVKATIDYNKVNDKLQKILNSVLDKFQYIIVNNCNYHAILNDIGKSISDALKDGELNIEEIPYVKVTIQKMEDEIFYIVFDKNNNDFQIKKWNEYILEWELPFDININ